MATTFVTDAPFDVRAEIATLKNRIVTMQEEKEELDEIISRFADAFTMYRDHLNPLKPGDREPSEPEMLAIPKPKENYIRDRIAEGKHITMRIYIRVRNYADPSVYINATDFRIKVVTAYEKMCRDICGVNLDGLLTFDEAMSGLRNMTAMRTRTEITAMIRSVSKPSTSSVPSVVSDLSSPLMHSP